jgi:hypothetical protein
LTTTAAPDLMLIVDDPNGTPVSKNITVKNFFGAVPSNTVFNARVSLKANTTVSCSNTFVLANVNMTSGARFRVNNFITTLRSAPSTNNALSQGYVTGQAFFTNTHLYIAVNRTTLKRVSLSTFT